MGVDRLSSGSYRARLMVEVSPVEIARLLEQVEADTSGAVADQVRATLRELFADAVDERLIASSPVQPVRRAGSTQRPDVY